MIIFKEVLNVLCDRFFDEIFELLVLFTAFMNIFYQNKLTSSNLVLTFWTN